MTDIRCPYCGRVAARLVPTDTDSKPLEFTEADLDRPIADYPWPQNNRARIINGFHNAGIISFRDLCRIQYESELRRLPNFGKQSFEVVKHALDSCGLRLGLLSPKEAE